MPAQDKVVVVKLKLVADSTDAVRGFRRTAAEADRLARRLAVRGPTLQWVDPDRLGPAAHAGNVARAQARQRVPAELDASRADGERRSRVPGSLGAQRQQERAAEQEREDRRRELANPMRGTARYYDQQAIRAEAGHCDRIDAARELHARRLNPDGSPMVGLDLFLSAPPGERGVASSVAPFLGRLAGRAAGPLAALYAGKSLAEGLAQQNQAVNAPFLRAGRVQETYDRNLPLIGGFYGAYYDTRRMRSGEAAALAGLEERRQEQGLRGELTGRADLRRDELQRGAASAQTRAEAFAGLRLDRLPAGLDRNTVGGARAYEEAKQLLPLQQRLTVASRERAAAEKDFSRLQAEEAKKAKELADIDKRLGDARQRRQGKAGSTSTEDGAEAGYQGAANAEAELNKARENKQAELDAAREARKSGEANLIDKKSGERAAAADIARQQLAQAEGRENEARAGAKTLGGLGRAGRQEAKVALQMVQRLGADNVDPETLALAEQVAPDTVGKAKEKAGEAAKKEFRDLALDERRLADTGQAAAETDRAREKVTRLEEGGLSSEAREQAEAATRGVYDQIAGLFRELEQKLRQLRADRERSAGNGA